ncbi:hypothetical protein N2152v2_008275 [Parachlorella kessleri]
MKSSGSSAQGLGTVLQAVEKTSARLGHLDARTLEKAKEQALARAKHFRQQVGSSALEGLKNAKLAAADIASSRSATEAGGKAWRIVHHVTNSPFMKAVSRVLVCLYFVNLVYDAYNQWSFMQKPDLRLRAQRWPQHYIPARFPWFGVSVLLPCALLTAAGCGVLWGGSLLVLYEAYDSGHLIWSQLMMLVLYGYKPNELVVKRLAVMGCTALVLANSIKESKLTSSYAGLLVSGDKEPSRRKSLVLLLGRLLMTSLFIYVGLVQFQRVIARDFVLWANVPHRDGHDNNWLLLEFLLSLPFAVGFKTGVSTLRQMHHGLHFVTNLAVAGGLLLLANFGAGRYTVDRYLQKKKE